MHDQHHEHDKKRGDKRADECLDDEFVKFLKHGIEYLYAMDKTKIQLSAKEMELVTNADLILTKNAVIKKATSLLETVQDEQEEFFKKIADHLPVEASERTAKISRGENYHGLPYLVLDYPRVFDKENVFTIRTMFWWGNFFSITLQLSGKYKSIFENTVIKNFEFLKKETFSICVNNKEWEHHFEENNYQPLSHFSKEEFRKKLAEVSFIKLAKKFPLQDWDNIPGFLVAEFKKITTILA